MSQNLEAVTSIVGTIPDIKKPDPIGSDSLTIIRADEFDLAQQDVFFERYLAALRLLARARSGVPLILQINSSPSHLPNTGQVIAGEIQEAVAELQADNLIKFLVELFDVLNPVVGLELIQKLGIDQRHEVIAYVNGQGNTSRSFEAAQEMAVNLSPNLGRQRQELIKLYTLLLSALKHAPALPTTVDLIPLIIQKIQDNFRNYPPELFTLTDDSGKFPSQEEAEQKFDHTNRCLKWLRSFEPGRLLPPDWRSVKPLILAFQSSDDSFRMLQQAWFGLHPEHNKVLKLTDEKLVQ